MDDRPDDRAPSDESPEPEEIPFGQKLYDRPFVLLVIGFVVVLVLFTGWGLWEVMSLPTATLP